MTWMFNNEEYIEGPERGIVYCLEYNGKKYIGKKVIRDKKGKLLNWRNYRGSSKAWLKYIEGNEDKVILNVLYLCANKSETHFFETYEIATRFAIWNDEYMNGNLDMIVNEKNSKNFINMDFIKKMISNG